VLVEELKDLYQDQLLFIMLDMLEEFILQLQGVLKEERGQKNS